MSSQSDNRPTINVSDKCKDDDQNTPFNINQFNDMRSPRYIMPSSLKKKDTELRCVLDHPNAIAPQKREEDAGFDLCSVESTVVCAGHRRLIDTGLIMSFNKKYMGKIYSRSGIAWKNSVDVKAGVIDSGYRNRVKVLLHNFGNVDFQINVGDRIAQIVFEEINPVSEFTVVSNKDDLDKSSRGEGGFGSTGISGLKKDEKKE
jgi:dUTP pyrophosphatase